MNSPGQGSIRSFNVRPGAIKTERIVQDMGRLQHRRDDDVWQPAEKVIAQRYVYWLATSSDAERS